MHKRQTNAAFFSNGMISRLLSLDDFIIFKSRFQSEDRNLFTYSNALAEIQRASSLCGLSSASKISCFFVFFFRGSRKKIVSCNKCFLYFIINIVSNYKNNYLHQKYKQF